MELTRGCPAAMLEAISGPVFYPVVFVYLDWPNAPVRAHSGVGVLTWGGEEWQGVGKWGTLSVPAEVGGSMVATEATVTLVAGADKFDDFVDAAIRNREGEIHIGCVADRPGTVGGAVLLADPVAIFFGTMDAMSMTIEPTEAGVQSSMSITLATGPGARSAATVYHSEQDQARAYPGDTAGRMTALAMSRAQVLTWPES
ncbi:hypothetical protein ABEB22_12545 [Thioclava sp. 'Guangxiensis']|uniref:hypothetical protein n=1 Tax=Thioclava sp. 'Guangxiensis' TaxID=3149044 RepID=UPI00387844AE